MRAKNAKFTKISKGLEFNSRLHPRDYVTCIFDILSYCLLQ